MILAWSLTNGDDAEALPSVLSKSFFHKVAIAGSVDLEPFGRVYRESNVLVSDNAEEIRAFRPDVVLFLKHSKITDVEREQISISMASIRNGQPFYEVLSVK